MSRQAHNLAVAALVPIVLLSALVLAQQFWPIGGGSSMVARLLVAAVILVATESVLTLPVMRKGPTWRPWLALVIALISAAPIHLLVPSLPD
jgi:hypothetical protein